jgi:hypothetical protein
MSGEKCRLNSTVFASAKGRQSRQPAGCSQGSGPVWRPGLSASLAAPAPMMTDDEVLAAADCAHTAHPHVSPTAIRNAGSFIILTDPMLIVRTLGAAPPMSVLGNRRLGALVRFHSGSRTRTRRQVAGHSPSALCPIVASCIVIIHNKKRWRKWAGRCPARQYL